jgi:UDP-N-acetylmuramyl tripeptide synthase
MLIHESRRLTGRNLISSRPGAVLDVHLQAGEEAAGATLIAGWRRQARRMLDAAGWGEEEIAVRRFGSGASLFLSAPLDGLYTATEIADWAWEAAMLAGADIEAGGAGGAGGTGGAREARGAAGAEGSPGAGGAAGVADAAAFAAAAERLRAATARERSPALQALRQAAAAHGVSLLADDDLVTVGLGAGSLTWPRGELPPPAAVDWAAVRDIPVALVTGTNGKTTTVRLAVAILEAAGRQVGSTSTDRIEIGREVLDTGDYSGPGGARTLLRDRRVEVAVLETARGGLLRRGLALDRVAAAAVTNVAADHLGEYGIESVGDVAEAKLLVTRAVVPTGRAVLNADDPELAARGTQGPSPVTWFSLGEVGAHLAAGGDAVLLDGETIVLAHAGRRLPVAKLTEVPLTFGGAARFNVANALAAVGLGSALGAPHEALGAGLAALRNDQGTDNPGRCFVTEIDGYRVLLDYAHNPHGLEALIALAASLPAARRLLLLGQAGDRSDEAIRQLARTAWSLRPDRVILKELPTMLRGRLPGEVPALLKDELLRLGAPAEHLSHAGTEVEAVSQALAWARPGDLLLLLVHKQRDEAMAMLNQQRGGWR